MADKRYSVTIGDTEYRVTAADPVAAEDKAQAHHSRTTKEPQQAAPDLSGPTPAVGATLPPAPASGPVGTRFGTGVKGPPADELGNMANFFKAALAGGVTQPVQRLRQLGGGNVTDEEIRATEAEIKKSHIGAGLGNVATMAAPFTGALKLAGAGARMLPKALQGTANFATVPALSAAQAGLTEPVKSNESTAKKMVTAAILGKATELGGRALFSPLTGMTTPTKEAQALIDMGTKRGEVLPGQGAIPSVYAGTDDIMGGIIGAGQAMTQLIPRVQKRANARIQQEIGDLGGMRIHPDTPPTREFVGRGDYSGNAFADIEDAYNAVMRGKTFPLPQTFGQDVGDVASRHITGVSPEVREIFKRDVNNIFPQRSLTRGRQLSDAEMQADLKQIRELVRDLEGENSTIATRKARAWKEVLNKTVAERNKMLNPAEIERVNHLDKTFHHATIFEKALGKSGKDSNNIASDLISTVESEGVTPLTRRVALKGHFQDITEPAKEILSNQAKLDPAGKKLIYTGLAGAGLGGTMALNPLIAALAVPLLGAGYAANTRTGAKTLMGQFEIQKKAAEIMRAYGRPALGASGANEWE